MPGQQANKPLIAFLYLLGLSLSSASGAAEIRLASNEAVLEAWQQLAQNDGAAPSLVTGENGQTQIEWRGRVTADGYRRTASGGSQLTPYQTGNYYKATVQGDYRHTNAAGRLKYAQFSVTQSDDPAVLVFDTETQLDMLQVGVMGQDYGLAAGDVTASFSTLGTNTALRGLYGFRSLGSATVSASVGKMAESWEALTGQVDRSQYLRDAYALKLDMPAGAHTRVFLTTQGFNEDEESLELEDRLYEATRANASTAGFSYQSESLMLRGELANGWWSPAANEARYDQAAILDGEWRLGKGGLRAGYHDIGRYYAALSAEVTPGIEESYLGGDWLPLDWLSLMGELRQSENEAAYYATDIKTTDSFSAQAGINLARLLEGLSLNLQASASAGSAVDGSSNDLSSYAGGLSYQAAYWSSGLNYNLQSLENSAWPATDGKTRTWAYDLSLRLNRDAARADVWGTDLLFIFSDSEQRLDSGPVSLTRNASIALTARRLGWGSLSASYAVGSIAPDSGAELDQTQWMFEAARSITDNSAVKVYLSEQENSGDPISSYREQTRGLQLSLAW